MKDQRRFPGIFREEATFVGLYLADENVQEGGFDGDPS
jgi:hypothetical protein